MPFAQAKKKRSGFLRAIVVLLSIIIIGGGAWYAYRAKFDAKTTDAKSNSHVTSGQQKLPAPPKTDSTPATVTTTVPVCPSFTSDGTTPAGWKTYERSRYYYRISYPATWAEVKNGGSLNNVPILDGLLFTPPGNQSPLYDIYVFKEGLPTAISDWETGVSDGSYNNAGQPSTTKESVLSVTNCTYQGFPAAIIVTKQNVGAVGVNYDIEFDVSAYGYLYDFSTGYNWSSTTLSNSTTPSVGDVLSVAESLHIY